MKNNHKKLKGFYVAPAQANHPGKKEKKE